MDLSEIVHQYYDAFVAKYTNSILPGQIQALRAIMKCRGEQCGEVTVRCTECRTEYQHPLSCGNRSCPKCQNYEVTKYLEKQRKKLLPVSYFMITFTLPAQLRHVVYYNQRQVFELMFKAVRETLDTFGRDYKYLGANIGMTCMLQTNTRRLDYHPHIHVVVPAGGINNQKTQWVRKNGKFLFRNEPMGAMFRGKLLASMIDAKIQVPVGMPDKWNVNCEKVGHGEPALEYLAKYLYRGVISEKAIIKNRAGKVTFTYKDGETGSIDKRQMNGEDFLWHIVMHVLPKGFRRVRDYGFLHGNAKKTLHKLQVILIARPRTDGMPPRPLYQCEECGKPMVAIRWYKPKLHEILFRNKASP